MLGETAHKLLILHDLSAKSRIFARFPCRQGKIAAWLLIRGSCYHDREREDPGMGAARKYAVIDSAAGKLDRRIFSDRAVYDDEMEKIFGRAWLMIGHESLVPAADNFFHTYMGEDPVILTRDGQGRLHALLNMCRNADLQGHHAVLPPLDQQGGRLDSDEVAV